jgi:hypothetical protein
LSSNRTVVALVGLVDVVDVVAVDIVDVVDPLALVNPPETSYDGGCASGKPENPAFSVIFLYHSTKNVELLGGFYFYTAEDELLMTNIAN